MAARPSNIKLYYGDMHFWRAECVRLGFFLGDVPFEDIRDQKRDDLKAAGKLTFGAVPVLEVDGKMLSQTQAMAVFAAKLSGIHPEDPWLAAKVDECLNGCTDVTGTIGATFRLPDTEKIPAREALIAEGGRLRMHLGGLNKLCVENGDCGYAVGNSITMADLAIWRLVGWLESGKLDGIPADFVDSTFPALAKLVSTVNANTKVQEWKAKYPKFYGAN
uniref:Glutathione transferase n=1 Tax=Odontella aurita TaxID=265563 RepID=A0A7S4I056_9STRA